MLVFEWFASVIRPYAKPSFSKNLGVLFQRFLYSFTKNGCYNTGTLK